MTDIINKISEARGNRKALLALANTDTCDQVAGIYRVSPIFAAPKVAQRVFDATEITIKSKGQPGSRIRSRRYDLTDNNQAYDALQAWGIRSEALAHWMQTGTKETYVATLPAHMNQSNITTELKITRHS